MGTRTRFPIDGRQLSRRVRRAGSIAGPGTAETGGPQLICRRPITLGVGNYCGEGASSLATDVMCCKLERIQTSVFMPQGTCLSWPRANRKSSSLIAPNASGCCALPGWPRSFSARSATIWVRCPVPGTGGVFHISCDEVQIWERKVDGGFPEAKILKQRVRDQIDPDRDLGHNDRTQ